MPIFTYEPTPAAPAPPDIVSGLRIGQYDLDGYHFGAWTDPVQVVAGGDVYTPGEVRNQDQENPRWEDVWFGRDYATPGVREFTFTMENLTDVRPALSELAAAWRPAYRSQPGRYGILRWREGDAVYRQFVRPRDFTIAPQRVANIKRRTVVAKLRCRDAVAFADDEHSITLDLVNEVTSTGLLFPNAFPWSFGESTQSTRTNIAHVYSPTPTPMRIAITGPVVGSSTKLKLWAPSWQLDFGSLTLWPGQVLEVDTYARTARVGGTSVTGSLTHASVLSALLQPGTTEFRFDATDESATTTATIYWRDTVPI